MANIQMGTAAGTILGNPPVGDFYIFIDSSNANAYTLRDSVGTDTILGSPNPATLYGLYSQTAQSATVTNTVTETSIVGSGVGALTVPANFFTVGDSYHGKIGGVISSQNGDTIEIRIKTAGVTLASTGVITLEVATTLGWELELDFTIATIGATGSICTNGNFAYNRNTGSLEGFVFQDVQAIDTTVSNTLDITVEWGQAKTQDQIYSANFVLFKTY
jgi:hypothetical protein